MGVCMNSYSAAILLKGASALQVCSALGPQRHPVLVQERWKIEDEKGAAEVSSLDVVARSGDLGDMKKMVGHRQGDCFRRASPPGSSLGKNN